MSKVGLQRQMGLLDAVALIMGYIISTGIFISPKGILMYCGSVGLSLMVWALGGFLSLLGALSYVELGVVIPKSGGEYAYIEEIFGKLPAFLFLFACVVAVNPATSAVLSLTFAQYLLQPIWAECEPPTGAVRLLAASALCLLTAINCYNVKLTAKVQILFTATKLIALAIIMVAGIYHAFKSDSKLNTNLFLHSNTNPSEVASSFYQAIFAYTGWNMLNFLIEELRNPYKTLPRAVYISLPCVVLIFVLTNVAYFAVLTPGEILASNAVAVTFAERIMGSFSWLMSIFVACSCFGGLNASILLSSRLLFVGSRDGLFPDGLSFVNINCNTPVTSLVVVSAISLCMLSTDVNYLINYLTFLETLGFAASTLGLLWLRYKGQNLTKIKMPVIIPGAFFLICVCILIMTCTASAHEVLSGLGIVSIGIPVYLLFIWYPNRPKILRTIMDGFNLACSKLFASVPEEGNQSIEKEN